MSKSNKKPPLSADEYGKLPPQEIEFERNILGLIMKFPDIPDLLLTANKYLKPEMFYRVAHQHIFDAIQQLSLAENSYDARSVTNTLRVSELLDDVGGPYYINHITNEAVGLNSVEYQSAFVFECFIRRSVIELLSEQKSSAYDLKIDIADIHDNIITGIEKIYGFMDVDVQHSVDSIIDRTIKEMRGISEGVIKSVYKCGDRLLDDVLSTTNYDIIGIASPRGAGKTRFLIKLMKGWFKNNNDVAALWYSMEDSDSKIVRLWATEETGIPERRMIGKGDMITAHEFNTVSKVMNEFKKLDCEIINDQESIKVMDRKFTDFIKRHENKTCFLVIDNFMLIEEIYNSTNTNQTQVEDMVIGTMRKIVNKAKRKNHKVILVFLHHMTKEMESRANADEAYRPKLSYMKGTTRIADVCTCVILLNNIGVHKDLIKKHSIMPDITCINSEGKTMLVKRDKLLRNLLIAEIAKNRDGEVADDDKVLCRYVVDMEKMKFSELKVIRQ